MIGRGKMPKRILVVDDEPRIIQLVEAMLTGHGYEVISAGDGVAALERVSRDQPDLVLLDVMMPKMDGTTVAEHMQDDSRTKGIPIVFLTSLVAENELNREGPEIGGRLFLAKPFRLEDLLYIVETATRK